jgi:hypothetical protein
MNNSPLFEASNYPQRRERQDFARSTGSALPIIARISRRDHEKGVICRGPVKKIDGRVVLQLAGVDVLHLVQNLGAMNVILDAIGINVRHIREAIARIHSTWLVRVVTHALQLKYHLSRDYPCREIATKVGLTGGRVFIFANQAPPIARLNHATWRKSRHRQVEVRHCSILSQPGCVVHPAEGVCA